MKNPDQFDKTFLSVLFGIMAVLMIVASFMFGEQTVPKAISKAIGATTAFIASLPDL